MEWRYHRGTGKTQRVLTNQLIKGKLRGIDVAAASRDPSQPGKSKHQVPLSVMVLDESTLNLHSSVVDPWEGVNFPFVDDRGKKTQPCMPLLRKAVAPAFLKARQCLAAPNPSLVAAFFGGRARP